jgi:hypothetical protein
MNLAMIQVSDIAGNSNSGFGFGGTVTHGSFPRFNPDSLADIWADSVIDDAGYHDEVDRVLSRLENVERLFPTAEQFRAMGVDTVKLAACLQEGLIVREFFNDTVNSLSVEDLNAALEHLLEGSDAFKAHPDDALDRSMHLQGCCGCHCRN